MDSLFWNQSERRPRAFWRIVIFQTSFLLWALPLGGLMQRLIHPWLVSFGETGAFIGDRYRFPIVAVLSIILLRLAASSLDRRAFIDFGLHLNRSWWKQFFLGTALGLMVNSLPCLLLWSIDAVRLVEINHSTYSEVPFVIGISTAVINLTFAAIWEESIFRAHPLRNLSEGLTINDEGKTHMPVLVVVLPAIWFALAHLYNGVNGIYSILYIVPLIFLGVVLGWLYYLTGELALPVGFHLGFNIAAINLFAIEEPEFSFLRFELTRITLIPLIYYLSLLVVVLAWMLWHIEVGGFKSPLTRYRILPKPHSVVTNPKDSSRLPAT